MKSHGKTPADAANETAGAQPVNTIIKFGHVFRCIIHSSGKCGSPGAAGRGELNAWRLSKIVQRESAVFNNFSQKLTGGRTLGDPSREVHHEHHFHDR